MDRFPERLRFPVSRCGCVARRLLRDGAAGRVAAVFRSSFYLEADGEFACIGNEALDLSPLNLITAAPGNMDWPAGGMRVDTPWKVSTDTVYVGGRYAFPASAAAVWQPQAVPDGWRAADLRRGLKALRKHAEGRIPQDGLGYVILGDHGPLPGPPIRKIARAPVSRSRQWLVADLRNPRAASAEGPRWVSGLAGLGPGLTPSGDDFLGGMMIALHCLGHERSLRRLWTAIRGTAVRAGNPISLAHLSAASEGAGHSAVHAMLTALLTGEAMTIEDRLDAVDRIGHTSGWDALAGIVATLEAWLEVFGRGPGE